MPAYVLARQRITDPDADALRRYREASPALVARFGGRFLARGGVADTLEGDAGADRIVIIEFPDAAAARAWYDSPEYQEIVPWRQSAADADFVVVDGLE